MSIILVGNGSSILDSQSGHIIDNHDVVVRFNSFKIKGFEKHTGIKTTIWFTVNKDHIDEINTFDEVIVHSWARRESCKLYNEFNLIRKCDKPDEQLIKSIGLTAPSTGLIAIHYLLKRYNSITITGFDWWDRDKHHYGDCEVRGHIHKPKLEYDIINNLVKLDKVRFL